MSTLIGNMIVSVGGVVLGFIVSASLIGGGVVLLYRSWDCLRSKLRKQTS